MTKRNLIWALALVVTLALTWQTHIQKSQTFAPMTATASSRVAERPSNLATTDYTLSFRSAETDNIIDLFAIPMPKVEPSLAVQDKPLPPTAPPLPFKYLGIVQELTESKLIVSYLDEVTVLRVGDVLESYKLEAINKLGNNTQLQFMYLPMNIIQTMVVNNAN